MPLIIKCHAETSGMLLGCAVCACGLVGGWVDGPDLDITTQQSWVRSSVRFPACSCFARTPAVYSPLACCIRGVLVGGARIGTTRVSNEIERNNRPQCHLPNRRAEHGKEGTLRLCAMQRSCTGSQYRCGIGSASWQALCGGGNGLRMRQRAGRQEQGLGRRRG